MADIFLLKDLEANGTLTLGRGKVISKEDMNNKPGDYPVYSSSAQENGVFGKYGEYMFDDERITWSVDGGGKLFYREPHRYSVTNVCGWMKINKPEVLNTKYLYYCLTQQWKRISFDYTYKAHPSVIREIYKVAIPSIEEQERSVDLLSKLERVFVPLQKEITLMDELIKARFVELFDNGSFPAKKLKDICSKITDGTHKTPNYLEEGITFISAKNITNGYLNLSDVKHISEDEYQEIQRRCQTEKYDILLSKSGSLGMPVIVDTDEKLGLFESLAVIKYDRNVVLPEFLCEQLKTNKIQEQFKEGEKGVAIKHLHLNVISNIDVIVPPMSEQKDFADFCKQLDKSKFECAFE